MLSPRQLEAFRRVIETGSVSRAAEAMHLSQPAVSKLVAALEGHLGFALFRRETHRLVPTAEALVFARESEQFFGQLRRLDRLAEELRRASRGHLVIASAPVAGLGLLPSVIHAFHRARPQVAVSLEIQSSPKLLELAAAQLVDAAIGLLPSDDPLVDCATLLRMPWVCVLPPGHRHRDADAIEPAQLEGEPFISLGEEDRTRHQVDAIFAAAGVNREMMLSAQLGMAACEFVRLGAGVTLMDPVTAYARANADLVVKPFRHPARFEMKLLLPRARTPSAVRDDFVRHLRESVAAWARALPIGAEVEA
jgi:DNA-binding transcriptional LysR family regulator